MSAQDPVLIHSGKNTPLQLIGPHIVPLSSSQTGAYRKLRFSPISIETRLSCGPAEHSWRLYLELEAQGALWAAVFPLPSCTAERHHHSLLSFYQALDFSR